MIFNVYLRSDFGMQKNFDMLFWGGIDWLDLGWPQKYRCVAGVEAESLEKVYILCQNDTSPWHKKPGVIPAPGESRVRSLSVGDVIEDEISQVTYLLKPIGFEIITTSMPKNIGPFTRRPSYLQKIFYLDNGEIEYGQVVSAASDVSGGVVSIINWKDSCDTQKNTNLSDYYDKTIRVPLHRCFDHYPELHERGEL